MAKLSFVFDWLCKNRISTDSIFFVYVALQSLPLRLIRTMEGGPIRINIKFIRLLFLTIVLLLFNATILALLFGELWLLRLWLLFRNNFNWKSRLKIWLGSYGLDSSGLRHFVVHYLDTGLSIICICLLLLKFFLFLMFLQFLKSLFSNSFKEFAN